MVSPISRSQVFLTEYNKRLIQSNRVSIGKINGRQVWVNVKNEKALTMSDKTSDNWLSVDFGILKDDRIVTKHKWVHVDSLKAAGFSQNIIENFQKHKNISVFLAAHKFYTTHQGKINLYFKDGNVSKFLDLFIGLKQRESELALRQLKLGREFLDEQIGILLVKKFFNERKELGEVTPGKFANFMKVVNEVGMTPQQLHDLQHYGNLDDFLQNILHDYNNFNLLNKNIAPLRISFKKYIHLVKLKPEYREKLGAVKNKEDFVKVQKEWNKEWNNAVRLNKERIFLKDVFSYYINNFNFLLKDIRSQKYIPEFNSPNYANQVFRKGEIKIEKNTSGDLWALGVALLCSLTQEIPKFIRDLQSQNVDQREFLMAIKNLHEDQVRKSIDEIRSNKRIKGITNPPNFADKLCDVLNLLMKVDPRNTETEEEAIVRKFKAFVMLDELRDSLPASTK